ncbi:MAG TPA: hypothetical protein VL633_13425 [Bacteroidota bacterium]|jgi:hypothetical protein|nr:hypothetical protein [Bacteroidota bacterium]
METESAFVKVLATDSLADIALIKSVLEGEDVQYYLQGENTKFLRPVDPVLLMVAKEEVNTVLELLRPLKLSFVPFNWANEDNG